MNLIDAKNLANELMIKHGIVYQGWTFKFTNAKNQFGVCNHTRQTIGISKFLTQVRTYEEVKNTILHEIAHALAGAGNGHNAVWRRIFVNMGGTGERCSSSSAEVREAVLKTARYIATCGTCGSSYAGHRKRKRMSACPKCCNKYNFGRFSTKYILNFVENNT